MFGEIDRQPELGIVVSTPTGHAAIVEKRARRRGGSADLRGAFDTVDLTDDEGITFGWRRRALSERARRVVPPAAERLVTHQDAKMALAGDDLNRARLRRARDGFFGGIERRPRIGHAAFRRRVRARSGFDDGRRSCLGGCLDRHIPAIGIGACQNGESAGRQTHEDGRQTAKTIHRHSDSRRRREFIELMNSNVVTYYPEVLTGGPPYRVELRDLGKLRHAERCLFPRGSIPVAETTISAGDPHVGRDLPQTALSA